MSGPKQALTAIALLLLLAFFYHQASSDALQTTTFINVGQGDSALVSDGSGFEVLIDGGKPDAGDRVVNYLHQMGINELEIVVASHADSDHIGGLVTVLQATDIQIDQVVYNGYPGDTATWMSFTDAVAARGLTLTQLQFPTELTWGNMQVYVLNPAGGLDHPETNDASLVLRIDSGSVNYLFTGDINSTIEATVVARGTPVASDILKVAHHGSASSSSAQFLAAADPQQAVISVGDNPYGHPSADTLSRLTAQGAVIWRTDQSGNILVSNDGAGYAITTQIPDTGAYTLYLPQLWRPAAEQPPVPTPDPTNPPEPTSQPTQVPPPTIGRLAITGVFADGTGSSEPDEYVEFRNDDTAAIQLEGWTLRDNGNHIFTFPALLIQPAQVCRVYTNQDHPETCGLSYGSATAIWNNGGDCAILKDPTDSEISRLCY